MHTGRSRYTPQQVEDAVWLMHRQIFKSYRNWAVGTRVESPPQCDYRAVKIPSVTRSEEVSERLIGVCVFRPRWRGLGSRTR